MNGLRRGLSRLELLLILATLCLLITLAIPCVEWMRERSRRQQCVANMRQLGMALHSYEGSFGCLPPAAFWKSSELVINRNEITAIERGRESHLATRQNWVILLLPYLQQSELAARFPADGIVLSEESAAARLNRPSLFICPSDDFNRADNPYIFGAPDGREMSFARGNYGINGGPQPIFSNPGFISYPVPSGWKTIYDPTTGSWQWFGSGVAGINRSFKLNEIENGTSTLVAINEIRAGIHPHDPRGVWAFGQPGSSMTLGHGVNGDDFGPNNPLKNADDLFDGTKLYQEIGEAAVAQAEMPFCDHCNRTNQVTSRSRHAGGVNTLFIDGSVRFVANHVSPQVWHVMHSRETPKEILDGKLLQELERPAARYENPIHPFPDGRDVATALKAEIASDNDHSESPHEFRRVENSLGMQFLELPAGSFVMGLPDKNNGYPFPAGAVPHVVTITRPFFLGVHEVTQQQYAAVIGSNPSWFSTSGGGHEELDIDDTSLLPVENITWYEAAEFCKRLSNLPDERQAGRTYLLPTEAEWEYACRSGSPEANLVNFTWNEDNLTGEYAGKPFPKIKVGLKPVGSFPSNPWGLYDMRGNVFEWVQDAFERDYYSHSPRKDPQGGKEDYLRVVRGWNWHFIGKHCKEHFVPTEPWRRNRYIGFRVVFNLTK